MTESESIARRALDDLRSRRFDARAVVVSGLVAGAVFLVVAIGGHVLWPGTSAWDTPLRIASLLVGSDVEETASTSRPGLLVLALVIHAMFSLTYAMLLDLTTRRMSGPDRIAFGALFGLALYAVNYQLVAPLLPAFAGAGGPVTVAAHVAFGVTAVLVAAKVGGSAWLTARRTVRTG